MQEKLKLTKGKDAGNEADINKSLSIINFLNVISFSKRNDEWCVREGRDSPFRNLKMKQSLSHFVTAPFWQGSRKKPSLPKGGWHGEAVTGGLRITEN